MSRPVRGADLVRRVDRPGAVVQCRRCPVSEVIIIGAALFVSGSDRLPDQNRNNRPDGEQSVLGRRQFQAVSEGSCR